MWRIDCIEIENLKFFRDKFTLNVGGRNVLLFGENGAGKSSVFWSVYTHFMAYEKSPDEARKYFDSAHDENLRNRFAPVDGRSGIRVTFGNGAGAVRSYEDSSEAFYGNDTEESRFMRQTSVASDFLNYKLVSELFDFPNSKDNDVFGIFVKEVFPFVDFAESLRDVEGNDLGTTNVGAWWRYLNRYEEYLVRSTRDPKSFNRHDDKYTAYLDLLNDFCSQFRGLMEGITLRANRILSDMFKVEARITWHFDDIVFNDREPGFVKKRTGRLSVPRLLLHAEMTAANRTVEGEIKHPKSFFNEAKISAMGMAMRLAILEQRAPGVTAGAVLMVDDLLISLDMSLRRMVVPVILEYARRWQMLVFTHDRSLFHLYRREIVRMNDIIRQNNEMLDDDEEQVPEIEWLVAEMYARGERECELEPVFHEYPDHLRAAWRSLEECRVPECANAIRRCCEQELKRLLPLNLRAQHNGQADGQDYKNLNGLIEAFRGLCIEAGCLDRFPALDADRHLVLNPFSHDNLETPFYRNELRRLALDMQRLRETSVEVTVGSDELNVAWDEGSGTLYEMRIDNPEIGVSQWVRLRFRERYFCYHIGTERCWNNPEVVVTEISDTEKVTELPLGECKINRVFKRLKHSMLPVRPRSISDILRQI